MFVLTKISDLIRLDPQNFATPLAEGLEDEINKKYANRVSTIQEKLFSTLNMLIPQICKYQCSNIPHGFSR